MTRPVDEETRRARLERVYAMIERAAAAGKRCPTADDFGEGKNLVPDIARAGRIRVEVYAHNWRVVEILQGPHKGKRTAPPPNRARRPYLVIDAQGSHRHFAAQQRVQPQSPVARA